MESAYRLFQMQKYDDARGVLSRQLEIEKDPVNLAILHNNIALIYEETNQLDKAIVEYSRSLDLNADEASTYGNLGVIYHRQEQWDVATTMYLRCLELDETDVTCRYRLSQLYTAQFKMEESQRELRKCIEMAPDYMDPYADLAVHLKDKPEALTLIEKFIDLEGVDGTRGLRMKAWILASQKEYLDAIAVYEEVVDREPNDPQAYMDCALLFCELQRFDEAMGLAHKAFELDPKNREVMHTLATILSKKGRNEEAEVVFKRMLKLHPDNDHVVFFYCDLLVKLDRKKDALALIVHTMEKYPQKESVFQQILDHYKKDE